MKYELLLRDIYKHTERAGLVQEIPSLQDAICVMKVSVCVCEFEAQNGGWRQDNTVTINK